MAPTKKRSIAIRMYNVGFGDAFLLFFPTTKGIKKVLIDCGTIAKSEHSIDEVAKKIIEDSTDGKNTLIDVVIATHRHRDHVSGFASSEWDEVEVREVWMPWTEDPLDPKARHIRETQNRLALQVSQQLQLKITRGGNVSHEEGLLELASNALTNESAMQTLHQGFTGSPVRRFLPMRGAANRTFTTDALPGVTIHALGPSRDESAIRNMDPPIGQSYLSQSVSQQDGGKALPPFPNIDEWKIEESSLPLSLKLSESDQKFVNTVGEGFEDSVAVALDSAVNGTSLMLIFQFGKATLLFPGDAQWGTWELAMKDPEWRGLLAKTTFYKVGHHGSHNATPVEYVDQLLKTGNALWGAMASVKMIEKWPSIPRKPLLEKLGAQAQHGLVRSDRLKDDVPSGFKKQGDLYVEATIPV